MKRILKIAALSLLIALSSSLRNKASAQYSVNADITYQTFYDDLSPYGDWIYYPEYGYVWQPDMGPDFRPYSTGGHWVWSDEYEWMWVSDYDWGWAPFHYGRWLYDPYYGWLWVPGYEWAPAWVVWRSGGDYYGWAPLRPGFNISIGFGNYDAPYDYWCFAPRRYITSYNIYDYCIDRRQNVNIFNNTVIINNYNYSRNVFVTGPRRSEAEIYTRERIRPVQFRQSSRPGRTEFRNNEVSFFRPNVRRNGENQYTPQRFERYDQNRVTQNDRIGNNSRDFRNGNNGRRDENINRGNNLPQQGNGSPFERRERVQSDQRDNNRFDRNNNNTDRIDNPSPMRRDQRQLDQSRERNNQQGQFEQRRQQENHQREFEQRRQQENQQREVEQRRQQENQQRQFEQRRQQENQQREVEQRRQQENQQRQFEQRRQQENQQRQFEQRQQQEQQQRQFEQRPQPQRQEMRQQPQPQQQSQPQQENGNGRGHGRGRGK